MCFDFDLDPQKRIQSPNFYGYIPSNSKARFIVFVNMFFFTLFHIALKILGLSLLATVGASYVAILVGGDTFFFSSINLLGKTFGVGIDLTARFLGSCHSFYDCL